MIFTTSWDDGNKLDLKLSKILLEHGIKGTFYIPISWKFRSLQDKEVKKLSKNFEIGSHSVSHSDLTKLPSRQLNHEILKSKKELEEIIRKEVNSFAYPFGKVNGKILDSVKAHYLFARTAKELQTDFPTDLLNCGFSVSITNRPRRMFVSSGVFGLRNGFRWDKIARKLFLAAMKNDGVFHLQGHSWEIEKEKNWDKLIDFFDFISKFDDVMFIDNGGLANQQSNTL
ncbi:MAG: polysaccharide deacetylase family protein [Candidatus Aenigmarchaeota archaeon]|nr:polysaccharide deacetylase family protein [Candidatus Aenigmarchaeota archaeon]